MSGAIVCLVYGFCATFGFGGQPTIELGYMAQDEFVPMAEMTGDHKNGDDQVIGGHTINWEWLDGGAEIGIDGQRFVVMKFGIA